MKNTKKRRSSSSYKSRQLRRLIPLGIVLALFGFFGLRYLGITQAYYSVPHAKCLQHTLSSNLIKAGQTRTLTVKMQNDGNGTWSSSYGIFLYITNLSNQSGWKISGNTLTSNVPQGATRTFNVKLTAPSTSPTSSQSYTFAAEMFIALSGKIPNACASNTITFVRKPTVSISSPSSGQKVSNTTTITASASAASGLSLSKVEFYINGSLFATDTGSPYSVSWNTKSGYPNGSYSLTAKAYDSMSQTKTSSAVNATVDNVTSSPPTPKPKPKPSGGGSNNTGGGNTANPPQTPDTSVPSKPTNFTAFLDQDFNVVILSWTASTDDRGIKGYKIERSTDQSNWETLTNNTTKNTFEDVTVGFNQKYYYRLRATDTSNNKSGYAKTDVTTGGFEPNVMAGTDSTIATDDQGISILIPAGTFVSDALCSVWLSTSLEMPSISDYEIVSGPYEISCRDKDGNVLTTFNKPLTLTASRDTIAPGETRELTYYGLSDQNWNELTVANHDENTRTDTIELDNINAIVVMAKQNTKSVWGTIIKVVIVFALIFVGTVLGLRYYLKRKATKNYRDYMKKAKGL